MLIVVKQCSLWRNLKQQKVSSDIVDHVGKHLSGDVIFKHLDDRGFVSRFTEYTFKNGIVRMQKGIPQK